MIAAEEKETLEEEKLTEEELKRKYCWKRINGYNVHNELLELVN